MVLAAGLGVKVSTVSRFSLCRHWASAEQCLACEDDDPSLRRGVVGPPTQVVSRLSARPWTAQHQGTGQPGHRPGCPDNVEAEAVPGLLALGKRPRITQLQLVVLLCPSSRGASGCLLTHRGEAWIIRAVNSESALVERLREPACVSEPEAVLAVADQMDADS